MNRVSLEPINLMVIGAGPHAKRIYFPSIKKLRDEGYDIRVKAVIELESRKDQTEDLCIPDFLSDHG